MIDRLICAADLQAADARLRELGDQQGAVASEVVSTRRDTAAAEMAAVRSTEVAARLSLTRKALLAAGAAAAASVAENQACAPASLPSGRVSACQVNGHQQ